MLNASSTAVYTSSADRRRAGRRVVTPLPKQAAADRPPTIAVMSRADTGTRPD
jgi:hypothetical protein